MTLWKPGTASLCLQRSMHHTVRVYTVPVYCSKGTCYIFVDVLLPCVVDAILFFYEELPKHKVLFRVSHKTSIYLNTEVCKEIEKEWGNAQRYIVEKFILYRDMHVLDFWPSFLPKTKWI